MEIVINNKKPDGFAQGDYVISEYDCLILVTGKGKFPAYFSGVVLSSGISTNKQGQHDDDWIIGAFKLYSGEIKIIQ
jgi:hypothetical protein